MILTTNLINTTVLKAYYSLALKSIKYYTGLALGKNNTCLFKEISLLRVYIDILKNFKIVGSEISCCCEIEGDYDTLLNNLSNATESPIQFNCDGTGYMLFNNQPYIFTYSYDEPHQVLMVEFNTPSIIYTTTFDVVDSGFTEPYAVILNENLIYSNTLTTFNNFISEFNGANQYGITLIDTGSSIIATSEFGFVRRNLIIIQGSYEAPIIETTTLGNNITETFNYVSFNEACSMSSSTYPPYQSISPLKATVLDVTGNGLQYENYTIIIFDQFDNIVTTQTFSGEYLIDPDAVALQWNIQYGFYSGWLMIYNGSQYVFTSPFNGINYERYKISFSQTENVAVSDIKASATGTVILVNNGAYYQTLVNNSIIGNAAIIPGSTADSIAYTLGVSMMGFGYTFSTNNNILTVTAPTAGTSFNGLPFQIKAVVSEILSEVTFCVLTNAANNDTVTITVNTDLGPVVIGTYLADGTEVPYKVALTLTESINDGTSGFIATQDGSCVTISPPTGSGSTYDGNTVTITKTGSVTISPTTLTFPSYVPASESYISYDLFEGGQNANEGPSVITYNSVFVTAGSTVPFSNRKPCITRCNETILNISGTPVEYYNDLIVLSILNPLGNPIYSASYPITMTLQEIVDSWNANPNTVLYPATLDGTVISFKSCLPELFGYTYKAKLVQYQGGSNATTTLLINSSVLPSSGPFTISDTLNGPIYNSTTSFDTIEEFIADFNDTNLGGYYQATYVGPETSPNPPPVYSDALLTISQPFGSLDGILLKVKASIFNGSTYGPLVLIGSYTVQVGDTNSTIALALRNAINNANLFQGTATTPTSGDLVLTVDDNATLPSQQEDYNGNILALYKRVPFARSQVTISITSSFLPGFMQITVPGFTSFPQYNILNTDTSTDIVTAYVNIINTSGTGFIAVNLGASLQILAPNPGSYFNGNTIIPNGNNVFIQPISTPAYTFIGGNETDLIITAVVFSNGENPGPLEPNGNSFVEFSVQGEEYNTIDLTYDYDSGTYIDTDTLSGAVNPTREEYINSFSLCTEQPGSCMSTTVKQTCLSNDDVKKVITNINKIIK